MTLTARPTVYAGVTMRSRLEATFAGFLDRYGMNWKYEPRAFASEDGQYLPDFWVEAFVHPGTPTGTYVEIKGPPFESHEELRQVQRKLEIIHRSEPEAGLLLLTASWMELFHSSGVKRDATSPWQEAKFGYYHCRVVAVTPLEWTADRLEQGPPIPTCRCGECQFPLGYLDPFTRVQV